MKFPKNLKPAQMFKILGLGLIALIVLIFIISLAWSSFSSIARNISRGVPMMPSSYSYDSVGSAMPGGNSLEYGGDYKLSTRNISPSISPVPPRTGTTGSDAEEYEVTEYSAYIETRNKEETCARVTSLKKLDYVIFENANEADESCNYTFKVKHDRVSEVLGTIKELNPEDLTENTYTIKSQVDDFTSETEILEKKLDSINDTLDGALDAYDEITALAKKTQDVASLAKIIDSRIQIIERLTQEKIAVTEQLDRLSRAKRDQLDRLEYTYFNVTVTENKYIDGDSIKDSWKEAFKDFFSNINESIQNATIDFISFIFILIPAILYFFVIVFLIKYGWRAVKRIWNS